jgi:hypothetical protein
MEPMDITWPTEPDWHAGVTGTRKRFEDTVTYPTVASVAMLRQLLETAVAHGAKYLHHGACTGWDEAAVNIVALTGLDYLVYAHPPINNAHLSHYALDHSHVVYRPKPYADRNIDIATASRVLLVGGMYPEFHPLARRSGTWMCARYGRRFGDALYSVNMQGELSDVTRQVVAGTDSTEAGV